MINSHNFRPLAKYEITKLLYLVNFSLINNFFNIKILNYMYFYTTYSSWQGYEEDENTKQALA